MDKNLIKLATLCVSAFVAENPAVKAGLEKFVGIAGELLETPQHKSQVATHTEVHSQDPHTININLTVNGVPTAVSQTPIVNLTNGQGGLVQITEENQKNENTDC